MSEKPKKSSFFDPLDQIGVALVDHEAQLVRSAIFVLQDSIKTFDPSHLVDQFLREYGYRKSLSEQKKTEYTVARYQWMMKCFEVMDSRRTLAQASRICMDHELVHLFWIYDYFVTVGSSIKPEEFLDLVAEANDFVWDQNQEMYVSQFLTQE